MDNTLIAFFMITQALVTILGFVFINRKIQNRSDGDIKIVLIEEVNSVDGFLKKSFKVKIKQQIQLNGIPLGEPITIAEHVVEEANKEQIERILKEYVDPFLALGKQVVELKSGSFFSKLGK